MLCLALLAVFILFVHPSPHLLAAGTPAPAIALPDASGRTRTAVPSAHRTAVVIVFVEPSCTTCQQKSAAVCALAADHPEADVVAVDSGEKSTADAQRFTRRYLAGCAVPLLLDADLAVSRAYVVAAVPTAYVVDSSGNIFYAGVGGAGIDALPAHVPASRG